jgi:hypothetical protein
MKCALVMIVAVGLAGCSEPPPGPVEQIQQTIIGGEMYINWAWGYHHFARYIDREGGIDSVTYAEADSMWRLGSEGVYTQDEIDSLLAKALPESRHVPDDTLWRMLSYVSSASAGPYSDTVNMGADQGVWKSFAFLYDSTTHTYRRIDLKATGDWRYENLSHSAHRLDTLIATVMGRSW